MKRFLLFILLSSFFGTVGEHASLTAVHALSFDGVDRSSSLRKKQRLLVRTDNKRRDTSLRKFNKWVEKDVVYRVDPPEKPETRITVRAVKETELKKLLGESAAANRPLLVNFWATWCEPCRTEFPDLVKLDAKYNTRGLDFAFVSLDDISDLATGVPDFLRQMKATRMSAYLLNADDQDTAINLIDPAWHGELPATFLYDRRGGLAYTHKGIIKPAELQAAVERVLSAK